MKTLPHLQDEQQRAGAHELDVHDAAADGAAPERAENPINPK